MDFYKTLQEYADEVSISLPTLRAKLRTGELELEPIPKGYKYFNPINKSHEVRDWILESYDLWIQDLIYFFSKRYYDTSNYEIIWFDSKAWYDVVQIADHFFSVNDIYVAIKNDISNDTLNSWYDYIEENIEEIEDQWIELNLYQYAILWMRL